MDGKGETDPLMTLSIIYILSYIFIKRFFWTKFFEFEVANILFNTLDLLRIIQKLVCDRGNLIIT